MDAARPELMCSSGRFKRRFRNKKYRVGRSTAACVQYEYFSSFKVEVLRILVRLLREFCDDINKLYLSGVNSLWRNNQACYCGWVGRTVLCEDNSDSNRSLHVRTEWYIHPPDPPPKSTPTLPHPLLSPASRRPRPSRRPAHPPP